MRLQWLPESGGAGERRMLSGMSGELVEVDRFVRRFEVLVEDVCIVARVGERPGEALDDAVQGKIVGDGCEQVITGTAKVSVPIIGGKAEQFIVDMTTKLMGKEGDLMVASLSK